MMLECMSCHKMKDESIMDYFSGDKITDICIECNNPKKWERIKNRDL